MVYTPNIPASTDIIANSQSQLQANSNAIDSQYFADHDGFSLGSSNSGMHNQITFLANQSTPSLTRNGVTGVSGIFTNVDSQGNSQAWFNNGVGSAKQITDTPVTRGNVQGVVLPSGVKIVYSITAISATTSGVTIDFPSNIVYTTPPAISATCEGASSNFSSLSATSTFTSATVKAQGSTTNIFFFAIGI